MKIELGNRELCLEVGKPLRFSRRRHSVIRCTAGILWLTVTGERGDFVLHAGQSHTLRGNGRVVIEAVIDARLRLMSPAQETPHREKETQRGCPAATA